MKIIKNILIGAGLFFTGRYIWSLSRTGQKAVVEIDGRVHKVTFAGVEVVVNYNIKNPTRSSIEMAAPLISLSYNGTVLASSSMSLVDIPEEVRTPKDMIKILPFKETGKISTSILLPHLSILGAGANLLSQLKDRLNSGSDIIKKVKLEIITTSTVFTKLGSYPYDEKTVIEV